MSAGIYHPLQVGVATISLLAAVNCIGADWWIAQNSTGSGSGADTNNCMALATANSSWPASAGDTVHLAGTFTNALTIGSSGSAVNPITIHFEPNAMFSFPYFTSGYWIYSAQSYIVIDGGMNGLIQNTSNGTVSGHGGTMLYNADGAGIQIGGGNHITIENLAIRNIWQRQTNTEPIQGTGDGNDIYFNNPSSGVLVSNCFLGEALNGIAMSYGSVWSSNITVIGCTFTNYNHGFTLGVGGTTTPAFNNLIIRSNTFDGGDMFEGDDVHDFALHRNAIFLFNESSDRQGTISNIDISYNFIRHGWHPRSSTAGTGAMFFDTYNPQMTVNVRVFNNISTLVYPLSWSGGGGFIAGAGSNVLVANNTAVGWFNGGNYGNGAISIAGTNCQSFNNILISKNGASASTWATTGGFGSSSTNYNEIFHSLGGLQFDHNIYNGQNGYGEFSAVIWDLVSGLWYQYSPDNFQSWTNSFYWQKFGPWDNHSTTATVLLNANYQPLTNDVVAIGNGTNLTAFGITDDFAGNPRPATGNWTIGAFETAAALSGPIISVTPASQDFGMVVVGASANQTFTVQNIGGGTLEGNARVASPLGIVSGGSYSLAAGQSQTITISYSPTATGTNVLTINFSGGGGAGVALTGTAAAQPMAPPQNLKAITPVQQP